MEKLKICKIKSSDDKLMPKMSDCPVCLFSDAPALPIHDSFIMHHGFGGELEEAMRREFHNRLGGNIPTNDEMLEWTPSSLR